MKQGDVIKLDAVVDAFRYGYKKKEIRVRIGDNLIWLKVEEEK